MEGGSVKYLTRIAMLAVSITVLMVAATSASAAPRPGFEEFDSCAGKNVDPDVTACFVSVTSGGHVKLGNRNVPIVNPLTLGGGLKPNEATGGEFVGETLVGEPQPVPGGIIGMTGLDWLIEIFPGGLLQLHADTELAGKPGNPLGRPFPLPIKVRLINPLLSSTCYIGSNTNPINLQLQVQSEGPIEPDPVLPGVIRFHDVVLFDNTFAAPAASGCGFFGLGLIDALVNAQSGLPAATGNEARMETDAALTAVQIVYPPAGFETTP
jgi:hypothetical protein